MQRTQQAHWCSLMSFASLSIPLQQCTDTADTNGHTGACLCLVCPFFHLFSALRHGVDAEARASTERAHRAHLCPVCLFFLSLDIPWTCRTRASTPVLAHVLCSFFLSLQHPMDAQDTSEHTGARPCPVCLYLISLEHPNPMNAQDTSKHTSARLCPVYLFFLSFRHPIDMQDMNEHTAARPCPHSPFSCPFDTPWMHRI